MLKKFTMQKSEKALPPLPQIERSPKPVPLETQGYSSLSQQITDLKQQNETLRYALRKASERITRLQQQMVDYQRYITRQHKDYARVTRKIHSAFQDYYSALQSSKNEIISTGVDLMNEPVQTYAAFSDSEEDLI